MNHSQDKYKYYYIYLGFMEKIIYCNSFLKELKCIAMKKYRLNFPIFFNSFIEEKSIWYGKKSHRGCDHIHVFKFIFSF